MSASTSARVTLFEDIFSITSLNPEGKKFERVNRLSATGTTFECDLLLDYNCQIYTLLEGEKMTFVLASTLSLDGSPDDHTSYNPAMNSNVMRGVGGGRGGGSAVIDRTLADNYEYVMHGRVFDVSYGKDGIVEIAISFGGLLCRLTGDQRHLSSILPDMRLYLLVKKD
jgi:DNA-directed RNA polymerase I, II, and III subunit RPABC3